MSPIAKSGGTHMRDVRNPYLIEGPAQICFSGGRTSGYMLHKIMEANNGLPKDCVVSFQNTGKEREETLAFINECSVRWECPIAWIEWDGFENVEVDRSAITAFSLSRQPAGTENRSLE